MKKYTSRLVAFATSLCLCLASQTYGNDDDNRSLADIAASIEAKFEEMNGNLSDIREGYREFEQLQNEELKKLTDAGLRVHRVDLASYEANQAEILSNLGVEYDAIALDLEAGQAERFYTTVANRTGYTSILDSHGNVYFQEGQELVSAQSVLQNSGTGGYNLYQPQYQQQYQPCYPQQQYCQPCYPQQQMCGNACNPCPGAHEFQQYNQGRRMGQRVFGHGYNGRTFRSTLQAAPLMHPYVLTDLFGFKDGRLFSRLENPTRIGEGRALNFMFPRIRYKNGYICSEHDMRVHLARRQLAIILSTSIAVGGGSGGGGPKPGPGPGLRPPGTLFCPGCLGFGMLDATYPDPVVNPQGYLYPEDPNLRYRRTGRGHLLETHLAA